MIAVLFIIAIFFAIWWTSVNIARLIRGHSIPVMNFIIMAAAWTAVITHIIKLW